MKRKLMPFRLAVCAALSAAALAAEAEPTRLVTQELAAVAPANSISADLEYVVSEGTTGGLRIGAFNGEVLVNARNVSALDGANVVTTNIGYKTLIANGLAAYGILSHVDIEDPGPPADFSATEVALGFAYTLRQGPLVLNLNPELLTDDAEVRDGDTTIFIRGGALYALPVQASGRLSLLGEVTLENSDALDTAISLGLRWEPRKDVTIDFVVLNDQGDNGEFQGVPGILKVNIAF